MKRKAKRPAQSPNTMPPERLVPILDYLCQHAQTWDDAREAVAIRICHAFAETTLGNGIGILEADCIDDYLNETDPEYRRCRAQDEREHWENVLFQGHLENSLPRFNPFSAISFMDGAGRRFALPYYLTCSGRCKTPIVPPTKSCPTPLPTTSTPTICRSTPPSSAPYTPPSPTSPQAKPKIITPTAAARGTKHSPTSPKPCPI